jgi:hypothetical protein
VALKRRLTIPNPRTNAAPETTCPNCDRETVGWYCSFCGQKQRGNLTPSIGEWVGEVFDELFAIDARLPRSLRKLAWPPGELTLEWIRGRRAQYVSPLRMYLAAAFLLFLAWPHTSLESGFRGDTADFLNSIYDGYYEARDRDRSDEPGYVTTIRESDVSEDPGFQSAVQAVSRNLPSIIFVLFVPLFAGLLLLVNRKDGLFVGSLIAAFHIHTVVFLAIIVTLPISLLLPEIWDRFGEDLLVFGLFAFVVASVRRVYQTTILGALVRAVFVTFMYFIVTLMVITGGVAFLSANR